MERDRPAHKEAESSGRKSEGASRAEDEMESVRMNGENGSDERAGGRVQFPRPFETALSPGNDEYSVRHFQAFLKRVERARKARR